MVRIGIRSRGISDGYPYAIWVNGIFLASYKYIADAIEMYRVIISAIDAGVPEEAFIYDEACILKECACYDSCENSKS